MKITKENIHAALDPVVSEMSLSQWDKQRIVQVAMLSQRKRHYHKHGFLRKFAAVVAAAALCLTSSMVVLASPALSARLNQLGQQTRRYLTPANVSCMYDGIRMDVLGSMQDDGMVVSYLSLEDTTGQNRLSDTIELCDIQIDGEPTVISGEPMPQEDGSFVIRVQGLRNPVEALDDRVTISLKTILSGERRTEPQDTGVTVGDIRRGNPDPAMAGTVKIQNASCTVNSGKLQPLMDAESMQVLKDIGAYTDERAPYLTFHNAGIVGDSLHLLAERDPAAWYNSCNFVLADEAGQLIGEDSAELCVGKLLEEVHPASDYNTKNVEYVMSLPEGREVDDLHIYYESRSYEQCIEGTWSVTYQAETKRDAAILAHCELDMNAWQLKRVKVTPFGLVAAGSGSLLESSEMPQVTLYLKDGTKLDNFSSSITSVQSGEDGEPDEISCKEYFDEPLDLKELAEIEVNGQKIWKSHR